MFNSVYTGFGFWNAGAWILFFLLAAAFVSYVRSMGRMDYKRGSKQEEIYLSGNTPPDPDVISVPASSAYWGFREALKAYYGKMKDFHSGIATDYVGWFVFVTALVLVLVLI